MSFATSVFDFGSNVNSVPSFPKMVILLVSFSNPGFGIIQGVQYDHISVLLLQFFYRMAAFIRSFECKSNHYLAFFLLRSRYALKYPSFVLIPARDFHPLF